MSYSRTVLRSRRRLGDLLVDGGLLTTAQLEEVLSSRIVVEGRPERVGETAVRLGFVSSDDIARTVAGQLELDYFSAPELPVDTDLLTSISEHIAKRHKVVPLWREGDEVAVACADPTNVIALDDVRVAVGARRVRPIVAPAHVVDSALTKTYGSARTASGILQALNDATSTAEPATVTELDEPLLDDAPVVRLTQEVLAGAVAARASDIHIEPTTTETIIRHRIDGVLHEALRVPRTIGAPMVSRIKLMGSLDIAEKRRPQDGRAHFRGPDGEWVDLRLSTLPTMFGERGHAAAAA